MPIGKEKIFEMAKGFRGRAKNCIKIARSRVEKALQHAYRGRKEKKRDWRSLWISRINAATREHQMSYSRFIQGLYSQNIQMNRKVLSQLAMTEPYSFKALVDQVRFMRGKPQEAPLESFQRKADSQQNSN
ncbi:hypothetical protein CEUSTIGMA_g11882.t1 [Chlamydomonas eustigma]|uniref:50S ribosomal protein L20 n=1 Tax=Chlamydomonas eustigma TaxID=1157962 RepID=A0A250XNH1_9CHLO|nr:hypothetical protein CEUSTIGMA_g11882.t1 [Chlamydomonas eustigma]|eukprot:GAX84462.1 hypothetical protein CEUSTIGMA_g11882.t1 [Chlamydomonas eustigma]